MECLESGVTTKNESKRENVEKAVIDKDEFNNWLMTKVSRQSTMISRSHGEKIIQFLRDHREKGADASELRSRYTASFRFQVKKRKFQLINVVGLGDILCMPIKDKTKPCHAMLGQHRQVIFKEDMFDVIDNAHRYGEKHRGYKGTFKKISATYCNIPREVVHKYVRMCSFCQKTHACYVPTKGVKKKPTILPPLTAKKKVIEMVFLTRCQIDILDMQNLPDLEGQFMFIGHFVDHHTKYNVLFPLKRNDAFYVARKLCRYVFGHFGLPRILHSNLGRKYVDEVISWILQLWATDAQILNGNPRLKRMNSLIQQRQKTIMILIETIRAKQADSSCWSVWLPGIQYSLNTNQFEPISPPAYDSVFNRRPRVYSYATSSREIPREEDLHELEEEDADTSNMNEVMTVSMADLMNSTSDSILISQLNQSMGVLDEKGGLDQRHLKETSVLTSELLSASSLASLPLTLGDHYTIIGSTLAVNGHTTLQIPIVNLGNGTLAITGSDGIKATLDVKAFNTIASSNVTPSIMSTAQVHFTSALELDDENNANGLHLTNHVANSLQLTNESVNGKNVRDSLQLGIGDSNANGHVSNCLQLPVDGGSIRSHVTNALQLDDVDVDIDDDNVGNHITEPIQLTNENVNRNHVTDSIRLDDDENDKDDDGENDDGEDDDDEDDEEDDDGDNDARTHVSNPLQLTVDDHNNDHDDNNIRSHVANSLQLDEVGVDINGDVSCLSDSIQLNSDNVIQLHGGNNGDDLHITDHVANPLRLTNENINRNHMADSLQLSTDDDIVEGNIAHCLQLSNCSEQNSLRLTNLIDDENDDKV